MSLFILLLSYGGIPSAKGGVAPAWRPGGNLVTKNIHPKWRLVRKYFTRRLATGSFIFDVTVRIPRSSGVAFMGFITVHRTVSF